jgi:O-antigen/teichoic acid export membrane protein
MMLPLSHLGSITVGVLFAAYSRLQTDRTRAASAYLRGIQLGSLLVAPVMAGMMAAGPHLVVGLYGSRWIGATAAMQVLCGVGLLRTVYGATSALTHAFGEVYAEFRRQAVYALLLVAAALAGKPWGITGVAVGAAAAVVFMYFAMAQLAVRITGVRWRDFFGAQLPGVLVGAWVGGAALGMRLTLEGRGSDSTAILAAVILTCVLAVPAGLYLLPPGVRPSELFRSLGPAVARLPSAVRLPVRAVMRLPHDSVPAPS